MKRRIQCLNCQDNGYVIDTSGEFCVARQCACKAACSVCGGRGHTYFTRDGYEFAQACQCRLRPKQIALFNAARIPARCSGTFDTFEPTSNELMLALGTAETTARDYKRDNPSKGFIISGPVGTGKTHLLCATLHWLTLEAGFSARYVEISFLYSEIKNGFSAGRSGLDVIQPLIEPDVLAIDELGRGRLSAFELETIDELIARRYNTRKTTLFATNFALTTKARRPSGYYDPVQDTAQASNLLIDRVGERIWSRLHEMCHWIQLPAQTPDFRRKSGS